MLTATTLSVLLTAIPGSAAGHLHLLDAEEAAVPAPAASVTAAPPEAVSIEAAPRASAAWQVGGALGASPFLGAAGFALAGLAVNWKADTVGSILLTSSTLMGTAAGVLGGLWLGGRARDGSVAAKVAIVVLDCLAASAATFAAGAMVVASAGIGYLPN